MIPCPLSCCINPGEKQSPNPVFKQQYVTEAGQIKMKMPISPMHYITRASYLAHDDRVQMRFDPSYSYYNERLRQNSRPVDMEYKSDIGRRIVTPPVSFVAHPRKNPSVHVLDRSHSNPVSIGYTLRTIDERLTRIELICRNNEEEIRDIIHMLKPRPEVDSNVDMNKLNSRDSQMFQTREMDANEFEQFIKNHESVGYNFAKYNLKYGNSNDQVETSQEIQPKQPTFNSGLNLSQEFGSKDEDKMFDVSEDLKNSNDILENYIKSMKFDSMADAEHRLDVLPSDYAFLSVRNQNAKEEAEAAKAQEQSAMSNIEGKFSKLLVISDSKFSEQAPPQHKKPSQEATDNLSESLSLLDSLKASKSASILMRALASSGAFSQPSRSGDLKVPSKTLEPAHSDLFNNPLIKLNDKDIISLLKGIDIPSKIKEANLTPEELLFLQGLSRSSDDVVVGQNAKNSCSIEGQNESCGDDFKCDILAPTRGDFTPLLRDDSIHALNSKSME
ncbi:hypothetical protein MACJ_001449 [Theileria orientalis]|uniref:Uncharacterized protein n=1 Tax=Theileria orientalis TaxID=68886 RepID=A0A976M8I9_THEOR|nr:hypothetical protein MACJ_001449 [Theileria orientalis]